jgi:regulator of nucleoside diphosphate kinase
MSTSPIPYITQLDAARIQALRGRATGRGPKGLSELIAKVTGDVKIVPGSEIPSSVVTVNSIVSFLDVLTRAVQKVAVVYPRDVSIPERRISVLSPVGQALLGRSVGHTVVVEQPDGNLRDIRVLRIHYQPEAAGELNR